MIDFADHIRESIQNANKGLEAMLLKFFGTYENAVATSHLYVLEEHIHTPDYNFVMEEPITYRQTITWVLRPKTEEELAREKNTPYSEREL